MVTLENFTNQLKKKKKEQSWVEQEPWQKPRQLHVPPPLSLSLLFSNPSLPPLTLLLYSSTPTSRCTPATSGLSDTGPSCVTASQQFMLCLIEPQGPLSGISAQLQISRVILIGPAGPTPLPTTRMEMKAPDSIVTTIRGLWLGQNLRRSLLGSVLSEGIPLPPQQPHTTLALEPYLPFTCV